MWLFLGLTVLGFAGGILTGLLGIGSGIIYVFILPMALQHFGITQDVLTQFTIANSFFGMTFASLSANVINHVHKDIHWKESLLVSVPATAVSILILKFIVVREWYSYSFFSLLLIGFLLLILISYHLRASGPEGEINVSRKVYVVSGLAAGSLSALTGLGGGGILIPILSFRYHLDIKKAKSISLMMIFMIAFTLTAASLFENPIQNFNGFQLGYIFFPVAIPLSIGVMLGSPAGVKLGHRLTSHTISMIFSLLILIVIMEKLIGLLGD